MTHVVCEPCINCKYTDCIAVCPVDCFYEGMNMLAIHPDECIDCEACVPECPTEAILRDTEVPAKWSEFIELNARLSQSGWPQLTQDDKKDCMGHLADGKSHRDQLDERPFPT